MVTGLAGPGPSRAAGASPEEWRTQWAAEAERFGQAPIPDAMLDEPDLVNAESEDAAATNAKTTERAVTGALELLEGN